MRGLGGDIVYNHADFRLMSRRTLQALVSFPERNLFCGYGFITGLSFGIGLLRPQGAFAGESKYPLKK